MCTYFVYAQLPYMHIYGSPRPHHQHDIIPSLQELGFLLLTKTLDLRFCLQALGFHIQDFKSSRIYKSYFYNTHFTLFASPKDGNCTYKQYIRIYRSWSYTEDMHIFCICENSVYVNILCICAYFFYI